jgi:hypothetical protein
MLQTEDTATSLTAGRPSTEAVSANFFQCPSSGSTLCGFARIAFRSSLALDPKWYGDGGLVRVAENGHFGVQIDNPLDVDRAEIAVSCRIDGAPADETLAQEVFHYRFYRLNSNCAWRECL